MSPAMSRFIQESSGFGLGEKYLANQVRQGFSATWSLTNQSSSESQVGGNLGVLQIEIFVISNLEEFSQNSPPCLRDFWLDSYLLASLTLNFLYFVFRSGKHRFPSDSSENIIYVHLPFRRQFLFYQQTHIRIYVYKY